MMALDWQARTLGMALEPHSSTLLSYPFLQSLVFQQVLQRFLPELAFRPFRLLQEIITEVELPASFGKQEQVKVEMEQDYRERQSRVVSVEL